jgi:macrolide-specific efflux system membrane fusion protein
MTIAPQSPSRLRAFVANPLLTIAVVVSLANAAIAATGEGKIVIESVVLRPAVEAEVPAQQLGVLAMIAVNEGDAVQRGQLLASLDDRVATMAVRQAELERAQAEAKAANTLSIEYAAKAIEVARAELRRSEETNKQFPGSISESQLDVERLTIEKLDLERRQAEHELELARFEFEVKDNALQAAQLDLDLHALQAPFAGVVSLVRGRGGEWVEPGTAVVRLVAIGTLRAEGFAPAGQDAIVRVGALVRLELNGNENDATIVEGQVAFVSPEVDPVSRQVRVWAEIDNREGRLQPGQQGRMVFVDVP